MSWKTELTVPTSSAHSTLTSSGSLRTCSTPTRRTGATTYATVPTSIGPCLGSGNLRTSPFPKLHCYCYNKHRRHCYVRGGRSKDRDEGGQVLPWQLRLLLLQRNGRCWNNKNDSVSLPERPSSFVVIGGCSKELKLSPTPLQYPLPRMQKKQTRHIPCLATCKWQELSRSGADQQSRYSAWQLSGNLSAHGRRLRRSSSPRISSTRWVHRCGYAIGMNRCSRCPYNIV